MLATTLSRPAEIIDTGHCTSSTGLTTTRPRTTAPDLLAQQLVVGPSRMCEAKEHVYCDGDPVLHLFKVEIGHVCIYKTMSDGRRQVLGFAYPGDLLGLGAVDEHAANAVAITRTVVRCIPIQALHHGMEQNPQLGRQIYEALARELQTTRDMLFTVSQRTATERVAAFLVAIARRTRRTGGDPAEFVLPMSRSDIADFLGLTIETVSRTFTKLRTSGVIELPHSVLVTVLDEAALDDLAEGRRP